MQLQKPANKRHEQLKNLSIDALDRIKAKFNASDQQPLTQNEADALEERLKQRGLKRPSDHNMIELSGFNFAEPLDMQNFNFLIPLAFNGSQTECQAFFNSAHFQRRAGFKSAHFEGGASFNSAHFEGYADFSGGPIEIKPKSSAKAEELESAFSRQASFQNARFDAGAYWNNRIFLGDASFGEAVFKQVPDFSTSEFKKALSLNEAGSSWPQGQWERLQNDKEVNIRLRKLMLDLKHDGLAGLFQSRIQAANRRQATKTLLERLRTGTHRVFSGSAWQGIFQRSWASIVGGTLSLLLFWRWSILRVPASFLAAWLPLTVYGLLSDYGFSWFRPLALLFISSAVFLGLHYQSLSSCYNLSPYKNEVRCATAAPLKPPLSLIKLRKEAPHSAELRLQTDSPSDLAWKYAWAGFLPLSSQPTFASMTGYQRHLNTLHKILSVFFLFLFGLAIRNRVRLSS